MLNAVFPFCLTRFAIDMECETASTNGANIYLGPQFLESFSDSELDFIMMYERFNIACDIVVNPNILLENNMQNSSITIGSDELMHRAPDAWLAGSFDAAIIEPREFKDESEFQIIRPAGGGGTAFQIIFEYVAQHMQDNLLSVIIIMTDSYAPFPQEKLAMGIPVLWLIANDNITPPWGKTARVSV